MTSYSTYAVDTIRFVDGTLSPDEETREDQRYMIVEALTSGAARTLLDTARDMSDLDAEVNATDWHSASEGWEIEALTDDAQSKLRSVVELFLDDNLNDILTLTDQIAWDGRWHSEIWHGDRGMAVYRIGMLLAYTLRHEGIGFLDYDNAPGHNSVISHLTAWLDAHPHPGIEEAWIDSTEEPCLLHIEG
jgi:hypothetical protein